jgi:hypothetical protein
MHIKTPPIDFLLSSIRLFSANIASLTRFFVCPSLAVCLTEIQTGCEACLPETDTGNDFQAWHKTGRTGQDSSQARQAAQNTQATWPVLFLLIFDTIFIILQKMYFSVNVLEYMCR